MDRTENRTIHAEFRRGRLLAESGANTRHTSSLFSPSLPESLLLSLSLYTHHLHPSQHRFPTVQLYECGCGTGPKVLFVLWTAFRVGILPGKARLKGLPEELYRQGLLASRGQQQNSGGGGERGATVEVEPGQW